MEAHQAEVCVEPDEVARHGRKRLLLDDALLYFIFLAASPPPFHHNFFLSHLRVAHIQRQSSRIVHHDVLRQFHVATIGRLSLVELAHRDLREVPVLTTIHYSVFCSSVSTSLLNQTILTLVRIGKFLIWMGSS